jgi:type VI secretion system protein ImpJ
MFLQPQQLQAAQRFAAGCAKDGDETDHFYNWGLRSIELNEEAILKAQRFEVFKLRARFRDGTLLSIPEDATVAPRDLRAAFDKERTVTVYLALPILHTGRPNVVPVEQGAVGRFQMVVHELQDESTGVNPQPVQLLFPNIRLMLSTDEREGYELLEIARVQRISQTGSLPRIDDTYYPPVLSTRTWPDLNKLLRKARDVLAGKVDLLANHLLISNVPVDSAASDDARLVTQLRALNEGYAALNIMIEAEGVHPLTTYIELCRLVGRLAIYGPERRSPELPLYDHDNLARCFIQAYNHLYGLLTHIVPPAYEQRQFKGVGENMEVAIKQEWLLPAREMFVAVDSEAARHDEVEALLSGVGPGALTMKLASSGRVKEIAAGRFAGLQFRRVADPPRVLPRSDRRTFFKIARETQEAEWANVTREGTLALRIVEGSKIASTVHDQTTIKVTRSGGTPSNVAAGGSRVTGGPATIDLTFWLFVV